MLIGGAAFLRAGKWYSAIEGRFELHRTARLASRDEF